ncbi:Norsolorinic acid reductase A [Madurella mycetomatis]|uniref:Norsolorinic acid reductase A n=1 Tax=Madurella mycetomatis TaxID=100816 RepID=A0A175VYC0_9PEZI|nr:Norsolorinic acid reductase A [Madurella mycetomatis]
MPVNPLPSAPAPRSPLGRYRLLSPTASVRVSPLCLGGMNFGNAWKDYMGACDEKTTEEILDYFFEQGGNFIDTSNNYQFEESEKRIGVWMKKRNNRDQMVIATKYTTNYQAVDGQPPKQNILVNFNGNGTKSLHMSVKASLEKLQTDYIDLLYVHWWDFLTSIPELMQSLNHLVASGKVLFLGISDTPAWVVSKANEYARCHGLRQFSVYQGRWSAAARDFEREIIPMCRAEGMALAPWGSLGGGKFKTEAERQSANKEGRALEASEADILVSRALEVVAKRKNTLVTSVALAYGNIEALNIKLSDEDIRDIEDSIPFDVGFPTNFLYGGNNIPETPGAVRILSMGGTLDHVPEPKPFSKE